MASIITIQIDKNIPIPDVRRQGGGAFSAAITAAFAEMQIGDSFTYSDISKSHSLATTVRGLAKKAGIKVVIRKVSESEYRVWRSE